MYANVISFDDDAYVTVDDDWMKSWPGVGQMQWHSNKERDDGECYMVDAHDI